MNCATASPRPGAFVAATSAKPGVAAPTPMSTAPATATATPMTRSAWTRSRARNAMSSNTISPARKTGMYSVRDPFARAEQKVDAARLRNCGRRAQDVRWQLVRECRVDRLERAAHRDRRFRGVDVYPASAARPEDLLVRAFREIVDRLVDGCGVDRSRDRVGDDRARSRHEVRGAGEPQCGLVGDVVAHLLTLGGLGDDVGEALRAQDLRRKPPARRAEDHEQDAERRQQPNCPAAQPPARDHGSAFLLARRGDLDSPLLGRRHRPEANGCGAGILRRSEPWPERPGAERRERTT